MTPLIRQPARAPRNPSYYSIERAMCTAPSTKFRSAIYTRSTSYEAQHKLPALGGSARYYQAIWMLLAAPSLS
jgi:hypothetical protein